MVSFNEVLLRHFGRSKIHVKIRPTNTTKAIHNTEQSLFVIKMHIKGPVGTNTCIQYNLSQFHS